MIKKKLKLLAVLFIILTVISSFSLCFADEVNEAVTTSEQANTASNTTSSEETEENIVEGDLYLFDNNITMDQLVDGNVYIMGKNITISGQVNGNLFVFGDSVTFDNCYVRYSVYACANKIYYNGACNDLYVAAKKLEMTYDSYVVRDVKATSNSTILKAAIGRNVDLLTNSVDFGSDSEVPIIYGDLNYSASEEKTLAEGIVEGKVNYSSNGSFDNESVGERILDTVLSFLLVVVTTLVIYALVNKFKAEYIEKLNYSPLQILKAVGIGLLTILVGAIISIILLITSVGAKLALIVIMLLILIGLLSMPIVAIFVTNLLKPVLKIEKTVMYYVVLGLVSIVLYGLTLIPLIGVILSIIITLLGYGLIVLNFLPKNELSDEEIQAKLAAKESKKALKAEKKAEKAKLKEEKKAEKNNKEDK